VTLTLRLAGLRALVRDLIDSGQRPIAVLLSEHEKRDLKQEMLELAPLTRNGENGPELVPDQEALCFIEGVPVMSDKNVPRGRAWIVPAPKDGQPIPVH
jgi:hypothetical protein